MGEVHRGRDVRPDREVAIEVLPAGVASDPEALRRFATEAKAVAARSHPSVLSILDVGDGGGVAFAVTELLDGETLRDALQDAPLPLDRATAAPSPRTRALASGGGSL